MGYYINNINNDKKIVYIIDTGGGMSVTNAAESVVGELNKSYPEYRVIYRDTNGDWDELAHKNGEFTGFVFLNGRME
jgi:hypothetical protein